MDDKPTLILRGSCLMTKFGFNDGDTPECLMDYWDDHGVDYTEFDWHAVLRLLVRRHLLPELEKGHALEIYDIETIHNPIRAGRIDGELIYGEGDADLPEQVIVSYEDVMTAIDDMAFRKNSPTPPMTDAERAARVDEMVRLVRWISTKDDWASILAHVGLRAAQLKQRKENLPQLTCTEEGTDD